MSFYITKVTATSSKNSPATVTFTKGLNIICGVSDSGKSRVLKCIQFAMGVINKPFDKEQTGYNSVELDIVTPNGLIHIRRNLGDDFVYVHTDINSIFNHHYDTNYKKDGNKNPMLNELWLKLLGIYNLPMIINNQYFSRQPLKWNTITKLFWLNKQENKSPKSDLLPSYHPKTPYFFASILFLLTGNNFPDAKEQDKDEISKAKKEAVRQFVSGQIFELTKKREKLKEALTVYSVYDIDSEMKKFIDNLFETEKSIAIATEESKDLLSTLLSFKEKEAEANVTFSHFQSLKSQYISDIKRLTFIVDGEIHLHSIDENNKCPFCDGFIQPKDRDSYIKTAKAELNRIIMQLQGLLESENDVRESIVEVQEKIKNLENRRLRIEKWIDAELSPQASKLREALNHYRNDIQLKHEASVLNTVSQEWILELQKQEHNEDINKPKFKPKEHFPREFNTRIDRIAYSILSDCNFENLNKVHFNMRTFDLEVNGLAKRDNHSKGYGAFINTVLGLTFRQYLDKYAVYKPELFVVDTPLLGLVDQREDDKALKSIRKALFQYFLDHQSKGQMIVVENTKDLPLLDYEGNGAKVIELTNNMYEFFT